jgi:hypothetical protein
MGPDGRWRWGLLTRGSTVLQPLLVTGKYWAVGKRWWLLGQRANDCGHRHALPQSLSNVARMCMIASDHNVCLLMLLISQFPTHWSWG